MTSSVMLSVAWLFAIGTAAAAGPTDADLARASAVALSGRVASVAAAWDADTIYTYVTIDVADVAKGWLPERRIVLKQLGGRVGDTALMIDGQALFDRGEEVFLFVSVRPRDGTIMTTALGRGKWTIVRDSRTGERRALRRPAATSTRSLGTAEERSLAALVDVARSAPGTARRDIVVDPREARMAPTAATLDATRFFLVPHVEPETPASPSCFTQMRSPGRWSATTEPCGELDKAYAFDGIRGTWLRIDRRIEALKGGTIAQGNSAFDEFAAAASARPRSAGISAGIAGVQTTRVSVASDGSQLGGESANPAISPDGRYVTFTFNDTILAIHDNVTGVSAAIGSITGAPRFTSDGKYVIYLDARSASAAAYDVAAGTTRTLNLPSTAVSDDLRYGAYTAGHTATGSYSFVRDLQTGVDTPIPPTTGTGPFPWADVGSPMMSPTGRYVAYSGYNQDPRLLGEKIVTTVWDRQSGALIPLGEGRPAAFTRDERFLLQAAWLTGFKPGNIVDLVSHEAVPLPTPAQSVAISAGGRYIALVDATQVVAHVYLVDRSANQASQVDINAAGSAGNASASTVAVDDSGRVGYASRATNLVPADTNGASDVFVAGGAVANAGPPGPPLDLDDTFRGATTVELFWRPPISGGAPTTYLIEAGSAPGLADVANSPTNSVSTSFSASVTLTTAVYVRVRAANAAGVGPPSNEIVLGPRSFDAPGAPTALNASVSGSSVTLSWQPDASRSRPDGYYIQAGSSMYAADLANFSVGNVTHYTAADVPPGVYFVSVAAFNAAGRSSPSNPVVVTVASAQPCSAPPAPPASLTWDVSGSTVTLGWMPRGGFPTSYVIEAGSSSGLADLASFDTGNSATSLTVSGVGGGTYFVRVRGRNACGLGAPSQEIAVIVR